MVMGKETKNYLSSESRKLFLAGFLIFCCIVLTPLIGTIALLWIVPDTIFEIILTCIRFFLPFVIIGLYFRNIPVRQGILVIVLASGIFRIIAEFVLSPVPFVLITTPDYLIQVIVYTAVLSIVAGGVSLFNSRKILSVGIIVTGIFFYCLWIIFNLN